MPSSELSFSKSLMVITKQLAHRVRSPQALKAHAARMRNAIADRHGIKRPAVGGVTPRRKGHRRGSRGKNIRKSNTGSDVSSDDGSDTETSHSYSSQHGKGNSGLPDEDASVWISKVSDYPSSLDVEAEHDESLYVGDVPTPKLSDHEKSLDLDSENASSSVDMSAVSDPSLYATKDKSSSPVTTPKSPDNKTAGASSSSSIDVDAVSDPSVYGTKDVTTPNMSVNETTESAPDGQKHILIEDEIDSVASHDESTPRVVTQTQQADATTRVVSQAVPPVDVGEDAIVIPNLASNLILREYTPCYVKDYPTIKGTQYWSDKIPGPAFPVLQETHFKLPYANWKGRFKNMFKYGGDADRAKYNNFSQSPAIDTYDDNLVTAKIGDNAVTIKDLKSLAPQEWLNDTIIDHTTAQLASIWADYNAKKKTPLKVAVFNSRFATLIIEHPMNSDPSCYSYTRVRGYGNRRLHQRSPLSFEHLIFPHNIGNSQWICIVVFPKQSLIVAVDSLRMARPLAYARTIFPWLYD
jgi:hypothetical protein